jgi:hypothetical protein
MSKERSPRFPAESLRESLDRTERLYTEAGRSPVTSEIAAKAIGYSGLSGASKTALAAMSYYGLIQREGDKHRISELGLRLIRPLSDSDKLESASIAALKPPIFAEIEENHKECTEQVLASVLLHSGFTDDGARRAAKVYKENVAFIEFLAQSVPTNEKQAAETATGGSKGKSFMALPLHGEGTVLEQYQIPLGANHAQLIFTGEELVAEDFDALKEYVEIFKKQFLRKAKSSKPAPSSEGA